MRIVIIAPGSRGDVQPYVALGAGLEAAGHVLRR
jgi:sterol 3beta-glucosyltransferase